jgi:uncharacterized small protein (DUF1192 family)
MLEEEESPRPQRRVTRLVLDTMGIDELQGYIAELRAEITRAEAAIESKKGHRGIAESFFRS